MCCDKPSAASVAASQASPHPACPCRWPWAPRGRSSSRIDAPDYPTRAVEIGGNAACRSRTRTRSEAPGRGNGDWVEGAPRRPPRVTISGVSLADGRARWEGAEWRGGEAGRLTVRRGPRQLRYPDPSDNVDLDFETVEVRRPRPLAGEGGNQRVLAPTISYYLPRDAIPYYLPRGAIPPSVRGRMT